MSDAAAHPDIIADIEAKGSITADDVLALRQNIFQDGAVSRAEAKAIFHLDHCCEDKVPIWREFYVDSLTDYFVWKSDPVKYVSDEAAEFLIGQVTHDGKIDGVTELELLVNIVHWSVSCPDSLATLVLQAVKDSVLEPDTALYGHGRNAGVVTGADVLLVRRAIYAGGGGGGYTVTRREADVILDLNNATSAADNHESWRDLFVQATANYLMFPRSAPVPESAEEYKRREEWLEERRGVGRLLMETGQNLARFNIAEGWRAMDLFGAKDAAAQKEKDAAAMREAVARESIDEDEARWLLSRIAEDGFIHENERALLQFICDNSPDVHPLLKALFDETGM